jgi:hypothetical protein
MKKEIIFILFFILTIFYFPNIKADVISINDGGSIGIVINPDNYIEGFFSKQTVSCSPTNCSALGYTCGNWNDSCGGILNCGTCSGTCNNGTCITPITPPQGGGQSGAGGATVPGIVITPSEINLTLSYNSVTNMSQRITEKIYITNNGDSAQTLSVSQSGLDFITILGIDSITINSHETKELDVDFISPFENADITGAILIDGYTIPVSVHVTSNPLWFDSNIVVLNKDYQVARGGNLKTSVELIPQGEPSRLDVTLNYVIKDSSGQIYLTKSETVLVQNKMEFERDFGTGMLPLGNYVISLDLVYPGGIAPSSAHFEVVKMNLGNLLGVILFFLIMLILIVLILILIVWIRRKRKGNRGNIN